MSDLSIRADIGNEHLKTAQSKRSQEDAAQKQQLVKQDPSSATGVQWAALATQPQAGQAVNNNVRQADGKTSRTAVQQKLEIVQPSLDDVAILSTAVSMNETEVEAPRPGLVARHLADRFNMASLESTYREYFKKSKSHNLLLERFMANVKFSAVKSLMSLMGVSADEMAKIQSEVRDQALAEIDSKIKNDWAYTKAMLEITQG
jgi:hypothetical protein